MELEQVEQLRRQLTNKKVIVDETRPELLRFAGQTGVIKTVNKNGRVLVQFLNTKNVGWYDIDLRFLKIIDDSKPEAGNSKSDEGVSKEKA